MPLALPMRRALPALLLAAALAACHRDATPPGLLTDPDAIADRLAEQARADFEGVRDFTVTGEGLVIYFRRTDPDSAVTFEYRAFTDDSLRRPVASPYVPPNTVQLAHGLRGNARLVGVEGEGADAVYVLAAADPGVLIGAPGAAAPGTLPDSVHILVDAATFHVLELRLTVPQAALDPTAAAGTPPITQRQRYSDFRAAGGLTLPYRSAYLLEGVIIPEEQRMMQGGALGVERQRAQQLPPGQRERALREIDRQARFYETGVMEETFVVDAVRVNAGVPEDAFAPAGVAAPGR